MHFKNIPKLFFCDSIVDYSHDTLNPDIWDNDNKLKSDVKDIIIKSISLYPKVDLKKIIGEIRIVGSSATYQYRSNSDIDIHLIPKDFSILTDEKWEILQKDVKTFFIKNPIYIADNILEFYVQTIPSQDQLGDALYDLINDKWIIEPQKIKDDFDSQEEFPELYTQVEKWMSHVDTDFGKLRRDVIDCEDIEEFLKNATKKQKTWLSKKLEKKLDEIETIIETLAKEKKQFLDLRKQAYKTKDVDVAWKDLENNISHSWMPDNIKWKILDRYKYISLIKKLEKYIEDKKITPDEIKGIEQVVGFNKEQEKENIEMEEKEVSKEQSKFNELVNRWYDYMIAYSSHKMPEEQKQKFLSIIGNNTTDAMNNGRSNRRWINFIHEVKNIKDEKLRSLLFDNLEYIDSGAYRKEFRFKSSGQVNAIGSLFSSFYQALTYNDNPKEEMKEAKTNKCCNLCSKGHICLGQCGLEKSSQECKEAISKGECNAKDCPEYKLKEFKKLKGFGEGDETMKESIKTMINNVVDKKYSDANQNLSNIIKGKIIDKVAKKAVEIRNIDKKK